MRSTLADLAEREPIATARRGVELARSEEIGFLAAAIAYYAFVSVLPALLIAVAVASAVGGAALVERVLSVSKEFLTAGGRETLIGAIDDPSGRAGATVGGSIVLLWSTLRVFRGLDVAFSRVYGTRGTDSVLEQLRDAGLVLLTVGGAIGAMFVVGVVLQLFPIGDRGAGLLALLIGLSLAFFPLYYVFPDTDIGFVEALPGTAVAAVGWVVLQTAFQFYVNLAAQFELYGVIGGVLLLVTWFYFAATLVLLGGVVNATLADRQGQGPAP